MTDASEPSGPAALRLFIAVELPDAVRAGIDQVIEMLRAEAPRGAAKWVRPEGVHLTLKFLGPVPAGRVQDIRAALNEAARGLAPFELHPAALGAFHGSRGGPLEFRRRRESYPHNLTVIWLGLGGRRRCPWRTCRTRGSAGGAARLPDRDAPFLRPPHARAGAEDRRAGGARGTLPRHGTVPLRLVTLGAIP